MSAFHKDYTKKVEEGQCLGATDPPQC
jgi:hypothetical protein